MKACVFFLWRVSRDSPLYPSTPGIVWSRIPDNCLSKGAFRGVGDSYFREWIKNWSDCRNWVRPTSGGTSSRYRCPSNFGTNKSALQKSESRSHACMWPWFSSNQSSRSSSFSQGKRRPAWRNRTLDLSTSRRNLRGCFWCFSNRTVGGCSRNYWFSQYSPAKSRATCLECWSYDGRGWEIQGYRDRGQ